MSEIKSYTDYENLQKEHKPHYLIVVAAATLFLCIVGYIIYANFAYFESLLNSEMAEDLAFVREAASQGTLFPEGWLWTREIRLMHITSIIMPFYLITGNLLLSYPLASSFMLIVNVALFFYMMSFKKMQVLPILIGLITLLMFFATLGGGEIYPVFNILFLNSSYSVHLASLLLTLGVYLRLRNGSFPLNRPVNIALLVITGLAAAGQGLQSDRMLISLYLPLFITELWFVAGDYAKERKFLPIHKSSFFVAAVCICAFVGSAITKMLFHSEILITHYNTSTGLKIIPNKDIFERVGYYFNNLFRALGLIGDVGLITADGLLYLARMFSIIALVLIMYKLRRKLGANKIMVTVLLFSGVVTSLIMTFVRIEHDITSRYLFPVVVLLSVCASIATEHFIKRRLETFTACIFVVVFTVSIISMQVLPLERRDSLIEDRQNVIEFIRETGLPYGYGVLWHGKVLEAIADNDFTILYIHHSVNSLHYRGVTEEQLYHTEDEVFLVISASRANDALKNDHERLLLETGTRHDFNGGWVVYLFDYNPWRRVASS